MKCFLLLVSKQPNQKRLSANMADSQLILADGDAFRDDLLGPKKNRPIFFFLNYYSFALHGKQVCGRKKIGGEGKIDKGIGPR